MDFLVKLNVSLVYFMKYKLSTFIFLSFLCVTTNASNDEKCFKDSKNLIINLYKKFPVDGNKIVESADRKTISNFFSNKLTNMLVKDYDCRSNLNGVCNIDFNILSNAQDELGKFSILQATDNIVTVKFDTSTHGEFIDFMIENKGKCKVVKNIKYNDNTNLIKVLQQ